MVDFAALPLAANAAIFAAATLVVLVCGVRLTAQADRFADLSGIGEAVTGTVFLGALTSLAGSVASITAAAQGHSSLALSNALGGIAAQTAFLVIADGVFRRANLEHAAASLPNIVSGVVLVLLLTLLLVPGLFPETGLFGVHPLTPALFGLYVVGVRLASRATRTPGWAPMRTDATMTDRPDEAPAGGRPLSLMLATILALGALVGLAGWAIANSSLEIAARTGIREGIVGALMTAVVTSTPEVVTTVAAVRRGALTLAVGGILGGNAFDVLFAAFADIAYRAGSIYHAFGPGETFLVLLSITMTTVLLLGLLTREKHGPVNIGVESLVLIALYGLGLLALVFVF